MGTVIEMLRIMLFLVTVIVGIVLGLALYRLGWFSSTVNTAIAVFLSLNIGAALEWWVRGQPS